MSIRQEKSVHISEGSEKKRKTSDIKNLGTELFYSEEKAILNRDVSRDVRSHQCILDNLATIMQQVQRLKGSHQDNEEMRRLRMEGVVAFAGLKKMNRLGHLRSKRVREQTQEAKQNIDSHHLQLQNLLYETLHLQREINKCLQFKSKHESISLVTKEEFNYHQVTKVDDEHKLMLARMDWELKERIKLSSHLEGCRARRAEVVKKISSKRRYLKALQPKLHSLLQASLPLQEDLDLRMTEQKEQSSMASHLPPALHLLYIQASSLARFVKGIVVGIEGDADLADAGSLEWQDTDSEDDDAKHHRRGSKQLLKRQQELFKTHPLQLLISQGPFTLTFHHLVHLQLVAVSFSFTPSSSLAVPASHALFTPLSFISNLFSSSGGGGGGEDDDGSSSPNNLNSYVLNKLRIDDLTTHLTDQVGRPFKWAQALCGVDVEMGGAVDVKRGGVEKVVKLVAERLASRLVLHHTVSSLGKDEAAWQALSRHEVSLTQWTCISQETYLQMSAGSPSKNHFLYSGVLKHPNHQHPLSFTTAIPFSYPTHTSFFTLHLSSLQGDLTATNDQAIRELECLVNTTSTVPTSSTHLSTQLTTLCAGLYAMLHPSASTRGPLRSLVVS